MAVPAWYGFASILMENLHGQRKAPVAGFDTAIGNEREFPVAVCWRFCEHLELSSRGA